MPDSVAIGPPPVTGATNVAAASAAALELPPTLSVLQATATFDATVIGRSPEGATLLRSAYGTITLKTASSPPAGTRVVLRVVPGSPPTVAIVSVDESDATRTAPPAMEIDLGTTIAATVISAPPGGTPDAAPLGTRLLLRVAAGTTTGSLLQGQISAANGGESLVETPLGTLALDRRLGLPIGTAIMFERLGAALPADDDTPPTQANGWASLDQALAALDKIAPNLAQQLRATLTPDQPSALAATLLFLAGALYRGRWPGDAVARALEGAGAARLRARLDDDLAALRRLSDDPATGPWRVLVLPLLGEAGIQPVRLYLRRRGQGHEAAGDGSRFVIDAELSRLGAIQLDGLVRGARLDLVLRTHAPIPPEMRDEARAIFQRASAAYGFSGDLVFATAARFLVEPMAELRRHVTIQI